MSLYAFYYTLTIVPRLLLAALAQYFIPSWWKVDQLPSLKGKNIIITGSTSGLGKETCLQLGRKEATIYCVGRNKNKLIELVKELKQKCGHANFHYLVADFLDLTTVERAADEFIAKGVPLHVLVNNAGTMESPFELSKQGIESTFAVNHFAAVVFTMRLLPTLAPKARIVNLSSLAHSGNIPAGGIRYEDLNNEAFYVSTGGDQRYGETKLANLHFTKFLQQYFDKSERDIFVNAVHPGIIKTNIFDNAPWYLKYSPFPYIDVSNGALTQIFVAGDDRIEKENYKGEYIACYCTKTIPSNDATNQDFIDQTAKWTKRILQDQFRKDWSW